MRRTFPILFAMMLMLLATNDASSQNTDNPGDYMTAVYNARGDMDVKYMQYMSAAAHGRSARKVEKLRQQVLDNIYQSKSNTMALPKYKGDNSLRQGSIDYIQLCLQIFKEDYDKIVNMEELAEQSVDEMQAYILLQEKVDEKLDEAADRLDKAVNEFAAKNNVKLIKDDNPLSEKMGKAGKLNKYINNVYMVFFKCNWQDGQIVKAMNNQKLNDVEQARNALIRYADEGMVALDTLKTFEGDPSFAVACRDALKSYKNIAEKDLPQLTDALLKQEEFNKMKKSFDAKTDHSKGEVDNFNKGVKEVNEAMNKYNQVNNKSNDTRKQAVNGFNNAQKQFADAHMPYFKKS